MDHLGLNFDKLEIETWDEKDGDEEAQKGFAQLSGNILGSSRRAIADSEPFVDYPSFLAYAGRHELDMIPHGDLETVERLGSGSLMSVFKGVCPSRWGDTEVAFKRLNLEIPRTKSAIPIHAAESYQLLAVASLEVRVLTDPLLRSHRNIVDLLAFSWEELGDLGIGEEQPESALSIRPILIVELAYPQYPTLEEYYNHSISEAAPITLDTKISIVSDVADALSAVHSCGVTHGDIKPQNILIFRKSSADPIVAKISDFGGCQPADDGGNVPDRLAKSALMGTEYWNAPEAYPTDDGGQNPQARMATRDYFSVGLLVYYILFEEKPFGDDGDISDENLAKVKKAKQFPDGLLKWLDRAMTARWGVAFASGAKAELLQALTFYETGNVLRRLYREKKVWDIAYTRMGWALAPTHDRRQYSIYFVILQFLHSDPQVRQGHDLMRDIRVFLNDKSTARTLRDVFHLRFMDQFVAEYTAEGFGLQEIRDMFERTEEPLADTSGQKPVFGLSVTGTENQRNFEYNHINQIPPSLRRPFLRELDKVASDPKNPLRVESLLYLGFCQRLGFTLPGCDAGRDFYLEAGRLGSLVGKQVTMLSALMQNQLPPGIGIEKRVEWLFDILLSQLPSKNELSQLILKTFTYLPTVELVLLRVFGDEGCRRRVIGKTFEVGEGGDTELRELFSAAISGQSTKLKKLLGDLSDQRRYRVHEKLNGFTMLHAAAEHGQQEIIRILIRDFEVDPTELNDNGASPLTLAMEAMENGAFNVLLTFPADFETLMGIRTLRHLASYGGKASIDKLRSLATLPLKYPTLLDPFPIQAYLDGDLVVLPDTQKDEDEPEFPPIFASILGDNTLTLWTLLEYGCSKDIYAQFSTGYLAPIHIAANLRPLHLVLLLHYGANPELRTKDGSQWTALHLVCNAYNIPRYSYPRVKWEESLPDNSPLRGKLGLQLPDHLAAKLFMIQLLIHAYNADVNAQDWAGNTAILHSMGPRGDLAVANFLVEDCGANIHIKDFRGRTCLHRAAEDGPEREYLEFCVEKGLSLEEKDEDGITPLMAAVARGFLETSKILVGLGCNLLTRGKKGWTCLDLALLGRHWEVFDFLFGEAETRGLLVELTTIYDVYHQSLVLRLIQSGPDITTAYLHRFPQEPILSALERADLTSFTLLHHSAFTANLISLSFLLSHGANPNPRGWNQITPLHIAYASQNTKAIELLEQHNGIDKACVDVDGQTPSMYGELAAGDQQFFGRISRESFDDAESKSGWVQVDLKKIMAENRAKYHPRGGWAAS
ncbi:MAG: hypothetical protein M1840_006240 [Geoglossum simile]|nr:MAG: hypothetical protein M1840_006240 [Geoglossum simile]